MAEETMTTPPAIEVDPSPPVEVMIVPAQEEEEKVIKNSRDLLALVDTHEGLIRTPNHTSVYATTYPYTDVDVKNISWLFYTGRIDGWADKLHSYYTMNVSARDYYPNPVHHTIDTPMIRLTAALKEHKPKDEAKLKYVIACQSRNTPAVFKLLVSYSRKAAGMDMFYELLNGNSVVFVGAVLKDVAVPVENPHVFPAAKFKRVESVEEAESLKDAFGIIC
ncbi:uncharacterized protein BDR25DRAFT_312031 [Lindgomyces ingoldianus]|uniref:Uncharacterized protein n=1 Tax=Lindgomyces ingoldianus TaxID=673940 RepID=A0ACB6R3G4_9PLEO|nr:uncharacterized protein BDR25DRAFT_312031 [Lindgomyces ingoldianus]KAF2473854.1 hypothetical protein BDR25DRAFT_312031 [Lindgomyces ingoldianus]